MFHLCTVIAYMQSHSKCWCAYIHTYAHTYMHACIHIYIHTYRQTNRLTDREMKLYNPFANLMIHCNCIHTPVHAYVYIHTSSTRSLKDSFSFSSSSKLDVGVLCQVNWYDHLNAICMKCKQAHSWKLLIPSSHTHRHRYTQNQDPHTPCHQQRSSSTIFPCFQFYFYLFTNLFSIFFIKAVVCS